LSLLIENETFGNAATIPDTVAPTQPTTVAEPGAVLAVDSLLDEDWSV